MNNLYNKSWILLLLSMLLSFYNRKYGIIIFLCMLVPFLFFSRKKIFCSNVCPRGSYLQTIISKISFNKQFPKIFFNIKINYVFLLYFVSMILLFLFKENLTLEGIGNLGFKMITFSTILATVLGIIFNPRTWCVVCPVGFLYRKTANNFLSIFIIFILLSLILFIDII